MLCRFIYPLLHLSLIIFYFSRFGISMPSCISIYHPCPCSMVCGIWHGDPPCATSGENDFLQGPHFNVYFFLSSSITSKDLEIRKQLFDQIYYSLSLSILLKLSTIDYNGMASATVKSLFDWFSHHATP